MQQRSSIICIFCGFNTANTRDHVPPKSIFTKPYPQNLITVPSCHTCNNLYSKHEESFRVGVWGLLGRYGIHPEQLTGKIIDSAKHNKKLNKWAQSNSQPAYRSSPNGVIHEKLISTPFSSEQRASIEMILEKTVRGLYFHESSSSISSDFGIAYIPFHEIADKNHKDAEMIMKSMHKKKEVGDMFAYAYQDISGESLWLLGFYGYVLFVAAIMPRKKLDSLEFARSILH